MRVLIFGAGGLLGRALADACRAAGDDVTALARADADIAQPPAVRAAIERARPELVLNAAALADVDRCEREPDLARRANAVGPSVLADAARARGVRLVHVSTDYVFSGEKGAPYDERDEPAPLNVYGREKLAGERAVIRADPANIVVRTAWLYGPGGKGFVARLPAILREQGEVGAIEDQRGSPTSVRDAAPLLRALGRRAAGGIYHVAGGGEASYFEIAREAARALGLPDSHVRPQRSGDIPRPAPRPRATPLTSVRLPAEGFTVSGPWAASYREFVLGT